MAIQIHHTTFHVQPQVIYIRDRNGEDWTRRRMQIRRIGGYRAPYSGSVWLLDHAKADAPNFRGELEAIQYPDAWCGCLEDELMRIARTMKKTTQRLR